MGRQDFSWEFQPYPFMEIDKVVKAAAYVELFFLARRLDSD
jgi:hypothetical protein